MLLSVFTRHSAGCKFSRDRACRRCNCPKWDGGQINGYYFRQSARTRQWAEADAVRQQLEEALAKGLPPFGSARATAESTISAATSRKTLPSISEKSRSCRSRPNTSFLMSSRGRWPQPTVAGASAAAEAKVKHARLRIVTPLMRCGGLPNA